MSPHQGDGHAATTAHAPGSLPARAAAASPRHVKTPRILPSAVRPVTLWPMTPCAATSLGHLSLTDPLDKRKCCRHGDVHSTLSFSRSVCGLHDLGSEPPAPAALRTLRCWPGTWQAPQKRKRAGHRPISGASRGSQPRTWSLEPEQSSSLQDVRGHSHLSSCVMAAPGHRHSLLHVA